MGTANIFIWGLCVMACAVIGTFFLRFWRKTRDRLFLIFALAFWLLGVNWLALTFTRTQDEIQPLLYLIRLAAFVLILFGIVDKNRAKA
jgi:hypothetical protein